MLDALLAEARLRWGLDPGAGVAILPAERLVEAPLEPTRPAIILPLALLGLPGPGPAPAPLPATPLPGRHGPRGRAALDVLRRLYPAGHAVGRFGVDEGTTIGELGEADLGAPIYLPPVEAELAFGSPWTMPWLSNRLRQPDGCPWDREQTHESLRNHLLEEAYEVYDALADGATPELARELGDLYLQVVLHAQLAAEAGVFDLADVQAALAAKIVHRHPHVFGDAEARTASDVNRQWERIKAAERAAVAAAGEPGTLPRSALEGISRSLPALAASQEMQERAAHLGYDWPSVDGILGKVHEELGELADAATPAEREEEVGDLLMVAVNLARHHGVQAEAALRSANEKFRRRFAIVERLAAERGVALRDMTFAQLDELWDAAKELIASGATTAPQAQPATQGFSDRPAGRGSRGARRHRPAGRPGRPGGTRMTIGNRPPVVRPSGRRPDELRAVSFTLGVQKWAEGSCRIRVGDTEVLCAATIEDRVPPHLRGKGTGWVTAEYAMLPRATTERTQRESTAGRIGGRTHEIQRLVGRSLRGVVDLARLGERTVTVDCDVLQADGGTRTASITGGYVALAAALITFGMERLLVGKVAAVSVGILDAIPILDLDYAEDHKAQVDFNVVGTDAGHYVELQGTAEGKAFSRDELGRLLDLAGTGLAQLFAAQAAALAGVRR